MRKDTKRSAMAQYFEGTLTANVDELADSLEHEGREAFEERLEEANDESAGNALDEFREKVGDEFEEKCLRLADEIDERCALVRKGRPPQELGAFDRDEMTRILATDTIIFYDVFQYDPEEGDRVAAAQKRPKTPADDIQLTKDVCDLPDEYFARERFLHSLYIYLCEEILSAATYHFMEPLRLYREAAGLVERAYADRTIEVLAPVDALRALECERLATERLQAELSRGASK